MGGHDPREDPPDVDEVPGLVEEGARLYNDARFWEAHEAWEEAWHALRSAGRDGDAEFLQGVILVAAAFENATRGKPEGFVRQMAQGLRQMRANPRSGASLGLADGEAWIEAVLEIFLEACSTHRFEAWADGDWSAPALHVQG